ncbi:GvpL/GvpF family gas vesicle protein [Nonomuraea sp. NPDC050536]|uniref:GvpL/GvpF family gas vesicle protein n=1 Tax=Nonomuraea sp. NPDC050536 TaxID=3364366 RepID=UPI0037C9C5DB
MASTTTRSEQKTGTYVYGVVPADVEVAEDARGVGDPPAPVKVVRHGELAALVSDVALDRPLGRPDDLVAHEQLLDATAAEVPVLPFRFGAVLANAEAVTEELLTPHHDELVEALKELEERAEFVVKGRYVEQAVIREVLDENPQVAQLRDEIKEQPEEVSQAARIQLGEIVNQAINAKREADTQALVVVLQPLTDFVVVRDPSHELDAAHLAVLIETERQDELQEAVDEFAQEHEGRIELGLRGPLAPWDFVAAAKPEG